MSSGVGPKGKRNHGEVRRTRPPVNQPIAKTIKFISQGTSGSLTDHISQRMTKKMIQSHKTSCASRFAVHDRGSCLKHRGATKYNAISWLSSGCFLGIGVTPVTGDFRKKSKFVRGSSALLFGSLGRRSQVTIQDLVRWDGSVSATLNLGET
jgi:hypothetical protein